MPRARDEAKVAEAARLYGLGLTTAAIGTHLGADPRTVQRWLTDITAPRGARKRPDVRDEQILDLRDREGLSFEEIARRVRMSKTGARMRYYALTGRERPERAKKTERGSEMNEYEPGQRVWYTTGGGWEDQRTKQVVYVRLDDDGHLVRLPDGGCITLFSAEISAARPRLRKGTPQVPEDPPAPGLPWYEQELLRGQQR